MSFYQKRIKSVYIVIFYAFTSVGNIIYENNFVFLFNATLVLSLLQNMYALK